MVEPLTPEVLAAMRDLDPRKKFVDDPDWTTERALALIEEVVRLRAAAPALLAACEEVEALAGEMLFAGAAGMFRDKVRAALALARGDAGEGPS